MPRTSFDLPGCFRLALCLAVALLLPLSVGNGHIGLQSASAIGLISGLVVLVGRPLGIILRLPRRPGFIAAFEIVAGFAGLSLFQLAVTFALRLSSTQAILLTAPAALALFFRYGRLPEADRARRRDWGKFCDGGILLLLSLLVTLWSRQALTALPTAEKSGLFPAWWDFFMHGVLVNYLNHYSWFAGRSLYLADTPSVIYHEGSYVMAALYAGLTHQRALQTTLAFWMPAGLVLTGMGLYGFASALASRAAGAVAAVALFLVPDASRYGLGNPLFSFQWLMQICPASGYGIALILIALGVFVLSLPERRSGLIFFSALLAGLSGLFRVQTAVPALLLFTFLFFVSWRPARRWHYWALAGAGVLLLSGALLVFERMLWAPHFLSGKHVPRLFLAWAHGQGDGDLSQHYADWSAQWTVPVQALVGVGLLLPAAFGLVLPALIVAAVWPGRPRRAWQIELIPFVLLAGYLGTIFLLPASATGDYTEFAHRPFVVVYAVMFAMLAAESAGILARAVSRRPWLRPALLALGLPVAAFWLVSDWQAGAHLQQQVRNMARLSRVPIALRLPEAAGYIRDHARPGDCVLSSDGDPYAVVLCLTERQAFVSKIGAYSQLKGKLGELANERWKLGGQLQAMRSYEELRQFGAKYRIRWFLLQPGDMTGWPEAMLAHCRFQCGANRVFDLALPALPAAQLTTPPAGAAGFRPPA